MDLKKLFKKKIKPKDKSFDSILDGIVIYGDISGEADKSVYINCDVIGSVDLEPGKNSTLIIREKGNISGPSEMPEQFKPLTVTADHIIVYGKIDVSQIHARESLVIKTLGIVNANVIKYGSITIDEGALITGRLMDDRE